MSLGAQENKIVYIDRHDGRMKTEAVYGERWLRWAYTDPFGRFATRVLLSRAWISRLYGWRMGGAKSRDLVEPFIQKYGISREEFEVPEGGYKSFNAFFQRHLAAGARPIDGAKDSIVFPADGRHLGWDNVAAAEGVYIKGQRWDIGGLLGDAALGRKYARGALVFSRLCPVDYHHFHYPVGGVAGEPREIGGPLYSVNPIALRRHLAYLWSNKRMVTRLEVEGVGDVYCIEVGATMVGSIEQARPQGGVVLKGYRKGAFGFGGSTVVTLFPEGSVRLSRDLLEATGRGIELYARMGERMGTLRRTVEEA